MAKITGGEVTYGRTVKTGDYENKRVDVKLTFTVEDDADHSAILQAAAKEAHAKAHEMLGIKPAMIAAVDNMKAGAIIAAGAKEAAAAALNEADKAKRGPGRPPKDKAETMPPGLKIVEAKAEPEKTVEEQIGEDLAEFNEDAAEAQPDITDTMLSTAMNRKVAELKPKHAGAAPKLIKELINTFVEPPKKSTDIPKDKRALFLKKLEELK